MTAQLPSRERWETLIRAIECESYDEEEIVSWVNSDEILSMARFALAAHEQGPVPNYIGSKNALDAIVAFIKSSSNPTLSDYNSVSERLFADNCQSLSSHVIEYITHIGEALEDLRQDASHPVPVPAVPDDVLAICQRLIKEYIANKGSSSEFICCVTPSRKTIGTGGVWDDWRALDKAVRAAMLNGGKS